MAKKNSKFNISIDPSQVVYTSISKSRDGYSSARMVVKTSDKEYMSINYEWEGAGVPSFAVDLMGFMKGSGMEKSGVWKNQEAAYEEYSKKKCKPKKKSKKEDKKDDM
jgi:hypothetical protein